MKPKRIASFIQRQQNKTLESTRVHNRNCYRIKINAFNTFSVKIKKEFIMEQVPRVTNNVIEN